MGEERLDVSAHAVSLGLEPEVCCTLLQTMCRRSRDDVKGLLAALDRGDRDVVREFAHSIKGAATGLDLRDLAALGASIEHEAQTAPSTGIEEAVRSVDREILRIEDALVDGTR